MTNSSTTDDQIGIGRAAAFSAFFVFVESFIIYWLTLAPTVTFVDSGELIAASSTLGVAHPPGFPLYILLAKLATLVPLGTIPVRIHVLSAAICVALLGNDDAGCDRGHPDDLTAL